MLRSASHHSERKGESSVEIAYRFIFVKIEDGVSPFHPLSLSFKFHTLCIFTVFLKSVHHMGVCAHVLPSAK